MKKLVLFLLFAAFVLSAKEAVADCVCYGTYWNNGFEYATCYCIEAVDPCYHLENEELNDREWETIPYGEWPAGLAEQACEVEFCENCGSFSYNCEEISPIMRRRYVGPVDGC